MSGTGKSSVVRELAARGFKAVDTDDGWSEPTLDGRQMWREDAMRALLATEDTDVLFVAGCEENQALCWSGWRPEPAIPTARRPKNSTECAVTSKPLSLCCGEWPITSSRQRSR